MIQSAQGGTCIEAWTEKQLQLNDPISLHRIKIGDKAAASFDAVAAEKENKKLQNKWKSNLAEWEKNGKKGQRPRPPRLKTNPLYSTNYPGNLYNGMIKQLIPFAIKGVVWYQGEANSRPRQAEKYQQKLALLISSWRKDWGQGDFPFYFVQLPNLGAPTTEPVQEHPWATIRESFLKTAAIVPNTGMAITIDIGEEKNLHPRNKRDVGNRLARVALRKTYGKMDHAWSGPIYKSCKFEGPKAIITFENGNAPLTVRGGSKLSGFALTGANGKTVHATAEISGKDTVIAYSPAIEKAVKVYYAWKANPVDANLINKEGLPASPFRYVSPKH